MVGREEFPVIGGGQTRHVAGLNAFLATPIVDGLIADLQVRGDWNQ